MLKCSCIKKKSTDSSYTEASQRSSAQLNYKAKKSTPLVLAHVPPYRCVGIKLDYGRPSTFPSAKAYREWMEKAQKSAYELKENLELGQIKLSSVGHRVMINPQSKYISRRELKLFKERMDLYDVAARDEKRLIEAAKVIKGFLLIGVSRSNKCYATLDLLKMLKLNKVIYLRNYDYVDLIRRMRFFRGNRDALKFANEREAEFRVFAARMRMEALIIYAIIKDVFGMAEKPKFWNTFEQMAIQYKNNVRINAPRVTIDEDEFTKIFGDNSRWTGNKIHRRTKQERKNKEKAKKNLANKLVIEDWLNQNIKIEGDETDCNTTKTELAIEDFREINASFVQPVDGLEKLDEEDNCCEEENLYVVEE